MSGSESSDRQKAGVLREAARVIVDRDSRGVIALGRRVAKPPVRFMRRRLRRAERALKSLRQSSAIRTFYRGVDLAELESVISSCEGKVALLVTVAFGRPDLIALQAKSLQQHFLDPYHLVVVDNSPSVAMRREIRKECLEWGASYVSLPPNPATNGGDSHGLALNWAQRNIVARTGTCYVGHLDHDVFLLKDVSYRDIVMAQGAYGHFQNWSGFRFFWPGLCFFASDFFDAVRSDFRPKWFGDVYADTGAGNWRRYYSKMNLDEFRCFDLKDVWADDVEMPFDKKESGMSQQEAAFTFFDEDWVHLVNGSNWADVNMDEKIVKLHSLLETS